MIDDNDIKKLISAQKEVFVTKEEFEAFVDVVSTKKDLENFVTKIDLNNVVEKMEKRFDKIDEKLDETIGLKHRVEYIENTLNIPAMKNQ